MEVEDVPPPPPLGLFDDDDVRPLVLVGVASLPPLPGVFDVAPPLPDWLLADAELLASSRSFCCSGYELEPDIPISIQLATVCKQFLS